jgi:hypothetical protein
VGLCFLRKQRSQERAAIAAQTAHAPEPIQQIQQNDSPVDVTDHNKLANAL